MTLCKGVKNSSLPGLHSAAVNVVLFPEMKSVSSFSPEGKEKKSWGKWMRTECGH